MGLIGFVFDFARRRTAAAGFAVIALVGVIALVAPSAALAAGPRRIGRRPALPAGARPVGALAQSTRLSVTVTLQPRDPQALAAYATAVSTPGSSEYHQYLSVSEFAQRFGPTAAEIDAARASLQAQGLALGQLSRNHLSFQVSTSAGRLASAFNTDFERYRLHSGRIAYANTSAPAVGGSGAAVIQGVIGLNNLAVPRPQGLVRVTRRASAAQAGAAAFGAGTSLAGARSSSSAVSPCASASSVAGEYGSYTANQIASAYDFDGLYDAGDLGSGVTVALYELEPYNAGDISTYQSCYGTHATVTDVSVDGGANCEDDADYCGLEDDLDIEDMIGLVPDASIRVYEGPNGASGGVGSGPYETYSQIVSDDVAKVISTSWGECESENGASADDAENTLFEEAATQGQSIFAADGDNGTTDCVNEYNGYPIPERAVDDPASQPYVTGVGGTSMTSATPPPSETVWNNAYGAGGGGVSALWPRPSYQSGFAIAQSTISCGSGGYTCREVPDVSANADPDHGYAVYWTAADSDSSVNGGWGVVGGTSAATPVWASLLALAEASSGCDRASLGFLNPLLYEAAGSAYSADFNDITSGNNSYDGVIGYAAAVGYDMASGLGSPKGAALATTLCGVSLSGVPSSATGRVSSRWRTASITATDGVGSAITYAATGLPAGITINSHTGVISGTPTKAERTTVTVTATDARGASASARFSFMVAGLPSVSSSALHVSGTDGRLSLTVRSGQYAPALKQLELSVARGARLSSHAVRSSVHLLSLAGKRQAITVAVSHGHLYVTFTSPVSAARLQLSRAELTFTRSLATGLARRARTLKLTLLVTDAGGTRSRLTPSVR